MISRSPAQGVLSLCLYAIGSSARMTVSMRLTFFLWARQTLFCESLQKFYRYRISMITLELGLCETSQTRFRCSLSTAVYQLNIVRPLVWGGHVCLPKNHICRKIEKFERPEVLTFKRKKTKMADRQ